VSISDRERTSLLRPFIGISAKLTFISWIANLFKRNFLKTDLLLCDCGGTALGFFASAGGTGGVVHTNAARGGGRSGLRYSCYGKCVAVITSLRGWPFSFCW
jgi:hypothetical protein